jgi:hypothetical protein
VPNRPRETQMSRIEIMKQSQMDKGPLSLAPLSFDEAVTDILTIKPEPKPATKKLKAEKRAKGTDE